MSATSEGPLVVSQRRFTDAVHGFVDRVPVWDRGVCRWSPPLYLRTRAALRSTNPKTGRRSASSRLPCRAAVLDWLHDVDHTVARWQAGAGTIHRLQTLAAKTWRPQDCTLLDDYTDQIQKWVAFAADILGDTVTVPLRGFACPACNHKFFYRRRDGETIRAVALTVSEAGAECGSCGATWAVEQLEFLARLIRGAG